MGTANTNALRTKKINGQVITEEQCLQEHEGLVWKVVHRYKHHAMNSALDIHDLYQEGMIGLMKAYRKFDESRGLKFSTYAIPKITGGIGNFIRDHYYTIKYPRSYRDELLKQGDQRPNAILFSAIAFHGDKPVTIEESMPHQDDISFVVVEDIMNQLDSRTKLIFTLSMNGYRQREIAQKLGITQAHVSRLMKYGKEQLEGVVA